MKYSLWQVLSSIITFLLLSLSSFLLFCLIPQLTVLELLRGASLLFLNLLLQQPSPRLHNLLKETRFIQHIAPAKWTSCLSLSPVLPPMAFSSRYSVFFINFLHFIILDFDVRGGIKWAGPN